MSNTVITNYTDLNGPSTKADSSVVVIVNKDGSLSVDQNLLGTLMGSDGSQAAGISVVRVGHEGRPDDATDSESEDDKVPHVTLSVDSYYNEPNSIIKYDSGAEMLQSLRIETRENSLLGFQNDHCYTPLTSPSQDLPQRSESYAGFDDPVIEITHTPPPKPVPNLKKITILEQQTIPKGKKFAIRTTDSPIIRKGKDVINKPVLIAAKSKQLDSAKKTCNSEDSSDMTSSSSGESIPDRDSDSDYKDTLDRSDSLKHKKIKQKPRILKSQKSKAAKSESKIVSKLKLLKNTHKKEVRERILKSSVIEKELDVLHTKPNEESAINSSDIVTKTNPKQLQKQPKKEKKTPAHVTALLSDMTSLFSTPDVIRRVSTDNKTPCKQEKELPQTKKVNDMQIESKDEKIETSKTIENVDKPKPAANVPKTYLKQKEKNVNANEKMSKCCDLIPQLDDASLAQILQDTAGISTTAKTQPSISTVNTMSSPGLTGPLSPTLDLLGGLQPEEEGWTEDLLMHVAQLVESSPNLQEVIDKQVMDKSDPAANKTHIQTPYQPTPSSISAYGQTTPKSSKTLLPRKDPIEIVRRDGRVITLPPIEAPATRASKRKTQMETSNSAEVLTPIISNQPISVTPEPQVQHVSKQYVNKKLTNKKLEHPSLLAVPDKILAESQDSWNSEDDPNRLWCICKQPHNNRFMICCDGCEDWFHGKCVNITKAMGQQMEEQGIEWRCPNCVKKIKTPKSSNKTPSLVHKNLDPEEKSPTVQSTTKPLATTPMSKTICIVCKKSARASSIYCSDACILKHAQDSLGSQAPGKLDENGSGKPHDKQKADSRVIVYERKSGRVLAGPNAPTPENLKLWLQKNPTFEVVRPGTLASFKPNVPSKKTLSEPNKIQTMLNFERIPRKSAVQSNPSKLQDVKTPIKMMAPTRESKASLSPKTPVTPKSQAPQFPDTPKPSTSGTKVVNEPKKITRTNSRSQSTYEKTPTVSPAASRRKDTLSETNRNKMNSTEPVRDNVRKALQEQLSLRMAESSGPKFNEEEIRNFANDTELELHELFKDTGIKYKAKYRSLMFNIKDRKNQSLWQKLCERSITPKQLVRLSPEELASQELAQWRDKEAKHQLELIKKTELDLLAASKTYVLKTHKGEEVMETKESVSTELDPNISVEDLVPALNKSGPLNDSVGDLEEKTNKSEDMAKKHDERKKGKDSKKRSRESRRESTRKSSRSSRRKSEMKDKEERSTRRSVKRESRGRSSSKDRSKMDTPKDTSESSRRRSRSRLKSKRRSKSRDLSRSSSKERERAGDGNKHRSKSQETSKSKHDSTDSELVERPKSAMMKEVHPEYDPHEPMITSAFSEEDLRKSREDIYEDSYSKNAIGRYEGEYDPSKDFDLHLTSTLEKADKVSETESDQEPSSTVDNSSVPVWNGCINMVDVARFYVAAHEVSGSAADLEEDLSAELEIVGRINPDTVWDYIGKMKRASNKDITILRLQAANDEEKMQYIALYSYLSSRNRLGVVKVSSTTLVKDFYIVPLPANSTVQSVLLPFDGPGLGEIKTHLLIAIVIRLRKKRLAAPIPKDIIPSKIARESHKRSYTPPGGAAGPGGAARAALPLPAYTSPALSTSVKDQIAASLAAAENEEAYSPGSSSSGSTRGTPPPNSLRNKMDELNRQIEEQKQQIRKMTQADSSISENEAYSPSRPMTPPAVVPLANIALPSNLHEILATIKQRSETSTTDVDMRTLPLP